MLLRRDGDAVIAIGQPAHAWLSGQLARAWGNARFGPVEPREEVCLGAEQHDIGMAAWERAPTLNAQSGLPHSFMELGLDAHLAMWSSAAALVVPQSRYAALLVSLHGTALYARRDRGDPRVREFLAAQRALQESLLVSLQADPATAPAAEDSVVRRNQRLVWTWDSLSLGVLLDWAPYVLEAVPAASGTLDVAVGGDLDGGIALDPWPFAEPELSLRCEGRRLARRFEDEEEMRGALAAAPWVTLEVRFTPP
jgi:hypothetical protein